MIQHDEEAIKMENKQKIKSEQKDLTLNEMIDLYREVKPKDWEVFLSQTTMETTAYLEAKSEKYSLYIIRWPPSTTGWFQHRMYNAEVYSRESHSVWGEEVWDNEQLEKICQAAITHGKRR